MVGNLVKLNRLQVASGLRICGQLARGVSVCLCEIKGNEAGLGVRKMTERFSKPWLLAARSPLCICLWLMNYDYLLFRK